ncbi:MAG: hypothetical protein KDB68_15905 [Planctomycetes bacterium]|nr:hypothetical protein [Planctomycetota bacterium]
MAEDTQGSRGVWVALIVLVVLVGGLATVSWWYLTHRVTETALANDDVASGDASAIPSLGSRGRSLPEPGNDEPVPEDNGDDVSPDDGGEDPDPEPEPEYENNAREIDIWLHNLGVATKAGDRKGMAIDHDLLKQARPHTLVDERVRFALENETSAIVRIQFMLAYHEHEAKYAWAEHVYDTRTSKFMGTDELYTAGEVEELKLIARELFAALVTSWRNEEVPERLMALLRNALDTEKPEWLLDEVRFAVLEPIIVNHMVSLARALEQEVRGLLLRRTMKLELREAFFAAFILTFDPHEAVFTALEGSEWWDYASVLPLIYGHRLQPGDEAVLRFGRGGIDWVDALTDSEEIPKLFERLLQGSMSADAKRLLIQRIAEYDVPNGRAMIESGLACKDANYPDYLVAFGAFANSEADLQRLTAAGDDVDVSIAQAGIEGLRRSGLSAADTELRKVLEQGANLGVKSQALGALLSRTADKLALLEEYLDVNKDASLRAVAVGSIPETNIERLQKVVEEDPSLRVRQGALNRLGTLRPESDSERKKLRIWFLSIKERDPSMVIRSAARQYAEALND